MAVSVSLRLLLLTDKGTPLNEQVEIRLRSEATGLSKVVQQIVTGPVILEGLFGFAIGPCLLEIIPTTFKPERRTLLILPAHVNELSIVFSGPNDPCPPPKIPDQLDEKTLTGHLTMRLAGSPADGSRSPSQTPGKVIWIENGDEVLVHLDSMQTVILDGVILVSVDLESDQTGRTTMVVSFAVGKADDPAGLIAVTDEFPRGNGVLASRWGRALQAAAWSSLLALATDHAAERSAAPLGVSAIKGTLSLTAGAGLTVAGAVR
jgi:hypothetical protein